jgi:hypothetical protein
MQMVRSSNHEQGVYTMNPNANPLTDYSPQMELESYPTFRSTARSSGPFSDEQELELAAELLEVTDERELEQFLGDLIKGAGRVLGKIVKSPIGQAIGGVLKDAAKTALPIAGGALGGVVGGPLGAAIGSNLASMAGGALGLELEGLSPEDRELEACKQFVRFAGVTVKNALEADGQGNPATVARRAAVEAARMHAPGLMNITENGAEVSGGPRRSGRWVRHHHKIILLGV